MSGATDEFATELAEEFPLTQGQIESFRQLGFVRLGEVLTPACIAHHERAVTDAIARLFDPQEYLRDAESETYARAFNQIMNIWRSDEAVKELCFSSRLAGIATRLLGTRGVRMYHDQALYKMEQGGLTPWHADLYYWPLANDNACTVWIPLQETPMEMGPLGFSVGSHLHDLGRDLEISAESEQQIRTRLDSLELPYHCAPFDLGEVSFHHGWTFHHAPPNLTSRPRKVMTVIYMDSDMRAVEPRNRHQRADLETWLPGVSPGEPCASELNPVLHDLSP